MCALCLRLITAACVPPKRHRSRLREDQLFRPTRSVDIRPRSSPRLHRAVGGASIASPVLCEAETRRLHCGPRMVAGCPQGCHSFSSGLTSRRLRHASNLRRHVAHGAAGASDLKCSPCLLSSLQLCISFFIRASRTRSAYNDESRRVLRHAEPFELRSEKSGAMRSSPAAQGGGFS